MTWVTAAIGLLSVFAWGDLAYVAAGGRARRTGRLALAWISGAVVTTWIVFVALWTGVPLRSAVLITGWIGIAAVAALRIRSAVIGAPAPSRVAPAPKAEANLCRAVCAGLALIVLLQVGLLGWAAAVRPLTTWDAWVNWTSKARVLVTDQGLTPGLYDDPSRLPTNLEYPLLLPLLEAWMFTWAGDAREQLAGAVAFVYMLSLLRLLHEAARRGADRLIALAVVALLVTTPRFELMAASCLADIPMAAMVLACAVEWQRFRERMATSPAPDTLGVGHLAVLCGGLAWLKNEGWLWWLVLLSVFACHTVRSQLDRRDRGRVVATLFGTALLIPGLWQLFLLLHGTERINFMPLTASNLVDHLPRLPVVAVELVGHLAALNWNMVWILVVIVLAVRSRDALQSPTAWLMLPVGGFLVLVTASYVLSRFDPFQAHVEDSIDRLIWQAFPLALWWLADQARTLGIGRERVPGDS